MSDANIRRFFVHFWSFPSTDEAFVFGNRLTSFPLLSKPNQLPQILVGFRTH